MPHTSLTKDPAETADFARHVADRVDGVVEAVLALGDEITAGER